MTNKRTVKYAGRVGARGEVIELFELDGELVVARPLKEGERPWAGDFEHRGFGDWSFIEAEEEPSSPAPVSTQRYWRVIGSVD